jgi:hypothetical protein
MTRKFLFAVALGALVASASFLPAGAIPMTGQPAKAAQQVAQAQVNIKYKSWRGYRGYRERRAGYRRHSDGYWYPSAAFTVRVSPGVHVTVGPRHQRWCRDRYRTYRASDNTFIVRGGVRQVCRSPY